MAHVCATCMNLNPSLCVKLCFWCHPVCFCVFSVVLCVKGDCGFVCVHVGITMCGIERSSKLRVVCECGVWYVGDVCGMCVVCGMWCGVMCAGVCVVYVV